MTLVAIWGIIIMLALILSGANIGLCMIGVGFVGYVVVRDWNGAISMIKTYLVSSSMSYSMTVVPLFILMGQFAYYSGISDDLFNSSRIWFGRQRGGLAYAAVVSCGLFGAICGSLAATTATMSRVAKPIMTKHGYKDEIIGGTLSSAGTLGVLIPPSTPFILYGLTSGESIGKMFAAGVIPGVIQALFFCGVIFIWCKRDKELCPAGEAYSMKEKLKALKGFLGMFLLFLLVLGGMFSGIFSITESAAMGVVVTFLILVLRRRFRWETFKAAALETISTVGMVKKLLGWEPRVAMLSYSTKGSGESEETQRVIAALELLRERRPDMLCDGEFQLEVALSSAAAKKKLQEPGAVAGRANIIVFPDLNSGNTNIKAVKLFSNANSIGPILTGFKQPVSDLSRTGTIEHLLGTVAAVAALCGEE